VTKGIKPGKREDKMLTKPNLRKFKKEMKRVKKGLENIHDITSSNVNTIVINTKKKKKKKKKKKTFNKKKYIIFI